MQVLRKAHFMIHSSRDGIRSSVGQPDLATVELSSNNRHMYSRALNGIGFVYQHQQKYALALVYLNRSLNLWNELNKLPIKARVLTDLGLYYFELGNYETADGYQEQAMQICKELNITNGAVTNMIHVAEFKLKQNKPEKAVSILNNTFRIAEEIIVKPKVFQIHRMLSDIYQNQKDLVKSLFHYNVHFSWTLSKGELTQLGDIYVYQIIRRLEFLLILDYQPPYK